MKQLLAQKNESKWDADEAKDKRFKTFKDIQFSIEWDKPRIVNEYLQN